MSEEKHTDELWLLYGVVAILVLTLVLVGQQWIRSGEQIERLMVRVEKIEEIIVMEKTE